MERVTQLHDLRENAGHAHSQFGGRDHTINVSDKTTGVSARHKDEPELPGRARVKRRGGYIFGGNFSGSITYHTLPMFWPVTSPRILSFTQ